MPLISSTPSHDIFYGLGLAVVLIIGTKAVSYQLRRIVELNEVHVVSNDPSSTNVDAENAGNDRPKPKDLALSTLETLLNNPSYEIRDAAISFIIPHFLDCPAAVARLESLRDPSINHDEASVEDAHYMIAALGPELSRRRGLVNVDVHDAMPGERNSQHVLNLWSVLMRETLAGAPDNEDNRDPATLDGEVQNDPARRWGSDQELARIRQMILVNEEEGRRAAVLGAAVHAAREQEREELIVVMQRGDGNTVNINTAPAEAITGEVVPSIENSQDNDNNNTELLDGPSETSGRRSPHRSATGGQEAPQDQDQDHPAASPSHTPHGSPSHTPSGSPSHTPLNDPTPHDPRSPSPPPSQTPSPPTTASSTTSQPSPPPHPSFPALPLPPQPLHTTTPPPPPLIHRHLNAPLLTSAGLTHHTMTLFDDDGHVLGQRARSHWEFHHGEAWNAAQARNRQRAREARRRLGGSAGGSVGGDGAGAGEDVEGGWSLERRRRREAVVFGAARESEVFPVDDEQAEDDYDDEVAEVEENDDDMSDDAGA